MHGGPGIHRAGNDFLFWLPDFEPQAVAMTITATNPIEIVIPVFISKSPQVRSG